MTTHVSMDHTTSAKRLRSHSSDVSTDVGPSPNTVKRIKTKAAKTAAKQTTALSLSQHAIDAIQSVANNSQENSVPCDPAFHRPGRSRLKHNSEPSFNISLQQQVNELKAIIDTQSSVIQDLRKCIEVLTSQIAVLPSLLSEHVQKVLSTQNSENSITASSSGGSGSTDTGGAAQTGGMNTDLRTYATVASSSEAGSQTTGGDGGGNPARHPVGVTMERSVVTAIYEDQLDRERRACNIVLTGMSPVNGLGDHEAVKRLFRQEFNMSPDIKRVRRIGTATQPGKPKPLLVTLSSQKDVEYLTEHARRLRQSAVKSVRENVFLNRDLTRAEQQAAYALRHRRREARKSSKSVDVPATSTLQSVPAPGLGPRTPTVIMVQAEVHTSHAQPGTVDQEPTASAAGLNVNAPMYIQPPPCVSPEGRLA